VHELHARKLQELDRLLQLGCHHQLLAELQVLLDFNRHGLWVPCQHAECLPSLHTPSTISLGIAIDKYGGAGVEPCLTLLARPAKVKRRQNRGLEFARKFPATVDFTMEASSGRSPARPDAAP